MRLQHSNHIQQANTLMAEGQLGVATEPCVVHVLPQTQGSDCRDVALEFISFITVMKRIGQAA